MYSLAPNRPRVQPGIEVALQNPPKALTGSIGLVTNQAGVDSLLNSDIDLLAAFPGGTLKALFGPEHGLRGQAQAGEHVATSTDIRTGLPVYSLYGTNHKPTGEMLADMDVLVVDLQDAGARYWTFIYTMAYCIQAAAEVGIPIVVLDRPNPIGGIRVEGNTQEPGFLSGVGRFPIAMRHGMTMGELAQFFNVVHGFDADLTVVPCRGWQREMLLWDTGLPYVPGSPNTPTIESLILYPGTCLFEGTTISEGRGTTKPFEMIGAPWMDALELASSLNHLDLPGVRFRPAYFVPTFSKYQGEQCAGVQIHVVHAADIDAVALGVHLIATIQQLYPAHFAWRAPYTPGGRYFIDLLAGTDTFRSAIDIGTSASSILASWEPARHTFLEQRAPVLMY